MTIWRIKTLATGNYYSGFDWASKRSAAVFLTKVSACRVLRYLKRDWPGDRGCRVMRAVKP